MGSTQTLYFSSLRFFCCFTENMILFRYETAGIENRIAQFVRFGNGEISVFPCSAAGMAKRKARRNGLLAASGSHRSIELAQFQTRT